MTGPAWLRPGSGGPAPEGPRPRSPGRLSGRRRRPDVSGMLGIDPPGPRPSRCAPRVGSGRRGGRCPGLPPGGPVSPSPPLRGTGGAACCGPLGPPPPSAGRRGSVGLSAGRLRPAARCGIPPALAALRRVHPRHPAGAPRRALGGWPRGRGGRCPADCGPPCVGGGPLLPPPARRAQPVPGWCPPAAPYRAARKEVGWAAAPPPAGGARAAGGGPLGAMRPPGL